MASVVGQKLGVAMKKFALLSLLIIYTGVTSAVEVVFRHGAGAQGPEHVTLRIDGREVAITHDLTVRIPDGRLRRIGFPTVQANGRHTYAVDTLYEQRSASVRIVTTDSNARIEIVG